MLLIWSNINFFKSLNNAQNFNRELGHAIFSEWLRYLKKIFTRLFRS